MPKEIVLDTTTAIIVLGSVFGFTHLKKIRNKVREVLHDRKVAEGLRKPMQTAPGTSSPPYQNSRSA